MGDLEFRKKRSNDAMLAQEGVDAWKRWGWSWGHAEQEEEIQTSVSCELQEVEGKLTYFHL
jgi:hypothetical protein